MCLHSSFRVFSTSLPDDYSRVACLHSQRYNRTYSAIQSRIIYSLQKHCMLSSNCQVVQQNSFQYTIAPVTIPALTQLNSREALWYNIRCLIRSQRYKQFILLHTATSVCFNLLFCILFDNTVYVWVFSSHTANASWCRQQCSVSVNMSMNPSSTPLCCTLQTVSLVINAPNKHLRLLQNNNKLV